MPFQQMPQRPQIEHGIGSGFVISPDGYIVTNNHVVQGATDISVTFSNRHVMSAKVIGTDPLTDLAVIKVNGENLPSIPWGDSTQLHPGQTVLAFGNPLGYQFSVTSGIVSGLNRGNPDADRRKPGEFIQTDAAINPGNSGGPLVNARGEVEGINTFLISETGGFSGLGFAVPEQIAKPIVDQLIRTGKVEHARIGITIEDVTPANAKFFGLKSDTGAVISQVDPDTPGSKAGLKVGDVITAINGQPVEDAGHAQVMITSMRPGTRVDVQILRNGQSMTLPVTLEAMSNTDTQTATDEQGKPRWGLGLSDLSPDVRQEMQIPANIHGAVVAQVTPGSPADDARLSQGDVILQVNHKDTPNADAVKNALAAVPSGQDVLLLVWSNGGSSFAVMHAPQKGQ
jgi:serine protease Do